MSFAMPEARTWHRALLTARDRGMQEKDGAEFFEDPRFISFFKDVVARAG
jgi:hypothetical protein